MSDLRHRVQRLTGRKRRPTHLLGVALYPADLAPDAVQDWLQALPCACGAAGCPKRRIGAIAPEPCVTADEWYAQYGRELATPPAQRQAERERWYRRHRREEERHG
jgi:hypothetical protein